ncbi:hypothetical protein FB451DRAFT_1354284 [Mycena latifolia]|nr:hypothetical protein FB451DRAFT_1354284 [Mycena latifolia]
MHFSTVNGPQVSPAQLQICAKLFSENYGVWGPRAAEVSAFLKPGTHVKMTADRLRVQCLSDPEHTQLTLCSIDGVLVGHAFATSWSYGDGVVCWITQLVVSKGHRRKGIATMLLRLLRNCGEYDAFGLASSHPAACIALSKLGRAQLAGSAFDSECTSKAVSTVFTKFFVDHREPLETIAEFQRQYGDIWPLGELPEGHEFLIIVERPI